MIKDDVLYLISEDPAAHGVFDEPVETRRMVYCTVSSVGRNEFYRAREYGLEPELVFILSDQIEYQGEKLAVYHGKRYQIIRTYVSGSSIELTCEEAKVDA